MQRKVKKDLDYKILHTSGSKVIKPAKMTDIRKVKQLELDCIDDLDEFMEDNSVHDIEDCEQIDRVLGLFNSIVAIYKGHHTDLKLGLGDGYNAAYANRKDYGEKTRRYKRGLTTRVKEIKKENRLEAEKMAIEKESRNRE